jgi:peptidoglycan/xylan/chitin deacetylase (PgdA/CDA1 family)
VPNVFSLRHLLTSFGLVLAAQATTAADAPVAPPVAPPAAHCQEHETEKIRQHHLKRLDTILNTDPQVLHENCRYVSELTMPPPAKKVVLTFDDGPQPGHTEFILATLKKYDIKAAFFLIGSKAQKYPELVAQIRADGHEAVGNHSWDHPNFHDIGVSEQTLEVLKTEILLKGKQAPKLFRYPYGNSTCDTNALLRGRGYRIVGWHVDSCDWAFDKSGSVDAREAISCGVLAPNRHAFVDHVVATVRAHNGGIILLHEIHGNTLKSLESIITRLRDEGFSFTSLDDPEFAATLR